MAKAAKRVRETDLYGPVRDYLEAQGYSVQAEVKDCDVVARKRGDLVMIELKLQANLDLVIQAARRQRVTDAVYVAVPRPRSMGRATRWPGIKHVLRRLEIGLIFVSLDGEGPPVEIAFHPVPFQRRRLSHARRVVIQETEARTGSYNTGGSVGRKLVTAYRENAIRIACCLDKFGPLATAKLRAMGTGTKTTSILGSNFYDWFERVDRGVYTLTSRGREEIAAWPDLVERIASQLGDAEARVANE